MKDISSAELLNLAEQNTKKHLGKKVIVKENLMVKNMLNEGKFEFHTREKVLGLLSVPLERPYDSKLNIKSIIMDIRTNINKITY